MAADKVGSMASSNLGREALFDINDIPLTLPEPGDIPLEVLRRSGRVAIEPSVQLGLGITQDEEPVVNHEQARFTRRAALTPIMFPEFFGIDTSKFAEVSDENYALSDPALIKLKLRQKSRLSMRQVEFGNWVLLNPNEHSLVLNVPEAYAQAAENRNQSSYTGVVRDTDEQQAANVRAGGHALESWIEPMENLMASYEQQLETLRTFRRRLVHPWQANELGLDVRLAATMLRDSFHDAIHSIGVANRWPKSQIQAVQTALDMRLTAGRGKKRLDEKSMAWRGVASVYGTHIADKKILVQDRRDRIRAEMDWRLGDKESIEA